MKQKSTRTKSTAIEFMRSYQETMNLMEAIGDDTVREQKTLLENSFGQEEEYTDEGVFNMDNLLDVSPYDKEEPGIRKEPEIWSAPIEPLDDNTKGQIAEELAKQFMNMKDEVIDISQIGPIATVVQSTLGLRQNLEDFITDMITGAADKQDSQAFAHGWREIPGVEQSGEPEGDKGPTDVAPDEVGVDGGEGVPPEGADAGVSLDVEVVRPQDELGDMGMDMGGDIGGDLGAELPAMGDEGTEEVAEVELPNDEDATADIGGEADGLDLDKEDELPELPDSENEEGEEGESEKEEEDDEEVKEEEDDVDGPPVTIADSVDARLEAITRDYMFKSGKLDKDTYVDAQLESLRQSLIGTKTALVEAKAEVKPVAPKKPKGVALQTVLESIANEYNQTVAAKEKEVTVKARLESIAQSYFEKVEQRKSVAMMESIRQDYLKQKAELKEKKLEATLESIVGNYHKTVQQKEKAITEATRRDQELTARLESIANKYRAGEKAVMESSSKELDTKLKSLVESYQASAPSRESVKQRLRQLEG